MLLYKTPGTQFFSSLVYSVERCAIHPLFQISNIYCLCQNEQFIALGGLTPYRLAERRVVRTFSANAAVHALSAINERGRGGGGGGPASSPRLPSLPWSSSGIFPSLKPSFSLLSTSICVGDSILLHLWGEIRRVLCFSRLHSTASPRVIMMYTVGVALLGKIKKNISKKRTNKK